jgi:hypothetical protein
MFRNPCGLWSLTFYISVTFCESGLVTARIVQICAYFPGDPTTVRPTETQCARVVTNQGTFDGSGVRVERRNDSNQGLPHCM